MITREQHRDAALLPGAAHPLEFERDENGRLIRLSAGDHVYLRQNGNERIFEDGWVTTRETTVAKGMLRNVSSRGASWVEEYLWNAGGRLSRIDGVEVIRDERRRVTACRGPMGAWYYAFAGSHLSAIEGPARLRHITRAQDGRPLRVREGDASREIVYDTGGWRAAVPHVPANWHRDEWGRLWTIAGADGLIRTTYLWDGYSCLGRIDGPAGQPLAAVFSLDPTGTPVRILTRHGVIRIPRDAFGESLLEYPGVPGLFGGAVSDGFVYFRSRALDPCLGSFTSPDPLDGLERDPRRAEGYRGPLPVDHEAAGPYTVCQNDPAGRVDATGEQSFGLLLSDFTWSLSNNIAGILGMDFIVNLWGSLFTGKLDRFFGTLDVLKSTDRVNSFSIRRDGALTTDRAFTYQHVSYIPPDHLEEQTDVRLLVPKQAFRPSLYGTLLRVTSPHFDSFLLQGARNPGNVNTRAPSWSRSGGPAEAAIPGSLIPRYPSGGLHLDTVMKGFRCDKDCDCTVTELTPSGTIFTGTIDERVTITVSSDSPGTGLAVIDDKAGRAEILNVVTADGSNLVTDSEASLLTGVNLDTTPLRLRKLGSPDPQDTFTVNNATAVLLDGNAIAAPAAYVSNDVIRLSQGGKPVAAAVVQNIQARLQIDSALPAGQTYRVYRAQAGTPLPAKLTATAQQLDYKGTPTNLVPLAGDFLIVGDTAAAPAKKVTTKILSVTPAAKAGDPILVQVDQSLATFGVADTIVFCTELKRAAELTAAPAPPDGGATVTYTAIALGQAKSAPILWIEDTALTPRIRTVTAVTFDALNFLPPVPGKPLPGNNAAPYQVERFAVEATEFNVKAVSRLQRLKLNPAADLGSTVALELDHITGTAIAAGNSVLGAGGFTLAAGSAVATTAPLNPANLTGDPTPSAFVVLTQGATLENAIVKEVRVTVTFDRTLPVAAATVIEAVPLARGGNAYDATFVGPLQVTLAATVAGAPAAPALYLNNENVNLTWQDSVSTPPTPGGNLFQIAAIAGNTLTLNPPAPGVTIPNTATKITVQNPAVAAGLAYDAASLAPAGANSVVVVRPTVGGSPAHFPRFQPGEMVEAMWNGAARRSQFRIADNGVNGGTLTLEGDTAIAPGVNGLQITRLTLADPRTGGSRLAVAGSTTAGAAPSQIKFRVWNPNAFPAGSLVAIVIDGKSFPAVVGAAAVLQTLEVEFMAPPKMNGAIGIAKPNVGSNGYSGRFTQEGDVVTLLDTDTLVSGNRPVPTPAQDLIAAIAYVESPSKTDATAGSGTVLPPVDPENAGNEVNRRQSLIDHETTHTLQAATWGPALLGYFPLGVLQGVFEFTTGIELPKFSKYVSGKLEVTEDKAFLVIADAQGVEFKAGKQVQVFDTTGKQSDVTLGPPDQGKFPLDRLIGKDGSEVQVRLVNSAGTLATVMNIAQILTVGGTLQFASELHYGGLISMVGKAFYALGRTIAGSSKTYPAKVEADTLIRLANQGDVFAFHQVSHVTIQSDKTSVVRAVEPVTDTGIRLKAAVQFSGDVRVAPYSLRNASSRWDWASYFPASVPDPAHPTTIKVEKVDGKSLELKPFDFVTVTADETQSIYTGVTSVDANGLVDLESAPPKPKDPLSLRVAKMRTQDPGGNIDQLVLGKLDEVAALRDLNLGWIRWMTDPYGQLSYLVEPKIKSHWDIPFRVGRYLFGSKSFLILFFPYTGYFWQDRAFKTGDNDHLSNLEQRASEESGDLYSPVGRLFGSVGTVGDVGRYWHFPQNRSNTVISGGGLDSPGTHVKDIFRVLPSKDTSAPDASEPNQGVKAGAASGLDVPDLLFVKSPSSPQSTAATGPNGFRPADLGLIPASNSLERAYGMLCAFSRPGDHRITVTDGIDGAQRGREAQKDDLQQFFFDVTVADVTATLSGQPLANGAAVTMVLRQRAVIALSTGTQGYTTTVTAPGATLTADSDLSLIAQNVGSENVEVSRRYDPASIAPRGLNLPVPLHVPVRSFVVNVVNTVPIRESVDPAAAGKAAWKPGETGFVLVPAAIGVDLTVQSSDPKAKPAINVEDHPELHDFLGDGRVYKVVFAVDAGFAGVANLTFTVQVGAAAPFVPLTAAVTLSP